MRMIPWSLSLAVLLAAPEAQANFHFMQVEQVIAGVGGDTAQQAIQLRMRFGGQNVISQSRMRAFDAAGQNPVLLIDIDGNVTAGTAGSRVLIATTAFAAAQGITPDFLLTTPIPPGYLAAGRLTFEHDGADIYWSLAWGGNAYTGSHIGLTTNDADGNFGPATASALPSTNNQALRFTGAASALSTTNLADYAITPQAAVFTNNAGASVTVTVDETIFAHGFEDSL